MSIATNDPLAAEAFLRFAIKADVLRFGTFQTKAGRSSPYFFNAGLFHSGALLAQLGTFYANALVAAGVPFDMLFGPAYKGIPLVATTAVALNRDHQQDIPFAYNRKEAKDHGEGGTIIGAPLAKRVMIIDDVISAGTSVRESVEWIHAAKASLAGVIIALDRQERGTRESSATQEVYALYNVPVIAIARLEDLIRLLAKDPAHIHHLEAIQAYRDQWGVF
ncbi:MAG: orotate phosphoribosyltransferase [Magnetococcales bacterium]|nr:orotate phosphoribosyltransferase [Magnetococcales bacterium]